MKFCVEWKFFQNWSKGETFPEEQKLSEFVIVNCTKKKKKWIHFKEKEVIPREKHKNAEWKKQSCKEEIGWWVKEKYVHIERIVITSCEI